MPETDFKPVYKNGRKFRIYNRDNWQPAVTLLRDVRTGSIGILTFDGKRTKATGEPQVKVSFNSRNPERGWVYSGTYSSVLDRIGGLLRYHPFKDSLKHREISRACEINL